MVHNRKSEVNLATQCQTCKLHNSNSVPPDDVLAHGQHSMAVIRQNCHTVAWGSLVVVILTEHKYCLKWFRLYWFNWQACLQVNIERKAANWEVYTIQVM